MHYTGAAPPEAITETQKLGPQQSTRPDPGDRRQTQSFVLLADGALYYVNWKLEYRHVITLDAHQVLIDKGHYAPRRRYRIARDQAALAVTPERHPWEGPGLTVHGHQDRVIVGEFLNRDDALSLLALLRKELLVRTHSPVSQRQI